MQVYFTEYNFVCSMDVRTTVAAYKECSFLLGIIYNHHCEPGCMTVVFPHVWYTSTTLPVSPSLT